MKLSFNKNLVHRADDQMLFSPQKMQIYKFNEQGYGFIKYIMEREVMDDFELYHEFVEKKIMIEEEYQCILKKLLASQIIIEN